MVSGLQWDFRDGLVDMVNKQEDRPWCSSLLSKGAEKNQNSGPDRRTISSQPHPGSADDLEQVI